MGIILGKSVETTYRFSIEVDNKDGILDIMYLIPFNKSGTRNSIYIDAPAGLLKVPCKSKEPIRIEEGVAWLEEVLIPKVIEELRRIKKLPNEIKKNITSKR